MDLGTTLIADAQAAEVVQVGEAALDDPALASEAGAVRGAPAGDQRPDAAPAQETTVLVVVVAAVGEQAPRASQQAPDPSPHRRYGVEQGQQLRDVVAVAAGQRDRQRDAGTVDQEVVLRA